MNRFVCVAPGLVERILFQSSSVTFHEASLTKVFTAAWKNYPRRLFATLAMRYSDFSERLSAPVAASSRNNVFVVQRKAFLIFMFVMDSNACGGMFGINPRPCTPIFIILGLTLASTPAGGGGEFDAPRAFRN